jgi:hypothetical protein
MKNKITDLTNHLFAQLERLGDEEITGDALASEIERAKAVTVVSNQLIAAGRLALDAQKQYDTGNLSRPVDFLGVTKQ